MTLRDSSYGEIETGIGDLFDYQGCTLSVVCLDTEATREHGKPIVTVRLYKGILKREGKQFQIEEGQNPPLFYFTAELVADCIRASSPQHPPEFLAIESAKPPEPKSPKVRKASKPTVEDQPTLW